MCIRRFRSKHLIATTWLSMANILRSLREPCGLIKWNTSCGFTNGANPRIWDQVLQLQIDKLHRASTEVKHLTSLSLLDKHVNVASAYLVVSWSGTLQHVWLETSQHRQVLPGFTSTKRHALWKSLKPSMVATIINYSILFMTVFPSRTNSPGAVSAIFVPCYRLDFSPHKRPDCSMG